MKTTGEGLIKEITGAAASEKGFVLILALVSMLAMTIIGVSLVLNMSTDMQLANNEREGKQAFQLAEAGVNEAIARMRLPSTHAKFVAEPAAVTAAAAATIPRGYRTTAGWGGASFNSATSADALNYAVTVQYLAEEDPFCDNNVGNANVNGVPAVGTQICNNEVVMFGQDFNICFDDIAACTKPSTRKGVYPVYRVTSIGTKNTTQRTVEVYVGASNLNIDTEGAINTNSCINISGGSATVTGGVKQGGACAAGCPAGVLPPCDTKAVDDMTTFLSGDNIASLASSADYQIDCLTKMACNADIGAVPDSMWGDCAGNTTSSLIYMDTHFAMPEPTISSTDLFGGCGRGILIVNGNITFSGNMTWEGLIYVMGTLTIAGGGGNLNVTGGVMANQTVQLSGNINASYDYATLEEVGRQAGSAAKTYISWKRK